MAQWESTQGEALSLETQNQVKLPIVCVCNPRTLAVTWEVGTQIPQPLQTNLAFVATDKRLRLK